MDLVCTYDSDGSGDEPKSQPEGQSSKEIDVIEITDSDSDTWSPVKSNVESVERKITESVKKKIAEPVSNEDKDKSLNSSKDNNVIKEKEIECIEIDEGSDCDVSITAPEKENISNKTNDTKEVLVIDSAQSKKIDYLNLEGSDSENEQQLVHEKVDTLLNSAAILCDTPCGPEKTVSINEPPEFSLPFNKPVSETHKSPSPSLKVFESSLQNENKTFRDGSSNNQDKIILPEILANKRIKRESETPKSTISGTDVGENEELNTPTSFMYRKDERITGAFAKSVVCRLPRQITRNYISHVNVITSLQWCIPQYSHLLLSASIDGTIKIWDMCCRHPVQGMKDSLGGLKAAKWSLSGEQIIAGGYGKKARVFDVLSGKEIISYDIFHHVSSIEIHPYMDDIFLCGTRNAIFGFDLRVNSTLPVRTFMSKCEEVLDLAFLDENEFVCSTSIVSHDSADRTIMVWDFSSGAIMSNQVYLERYTCPFLKVHPHDSCFIAQTNGDYIAAFSTQRPYKIQDKRYMGHRVSGYGVECDISPDGKYIATGDANGDIYFYNYSNTNVINKLSARSNVATNRLKWHPALNSTLASATWDGHIQIWK